MKTYRVAILGCGGRGRASGKAYRANPRTEIVGVCDLVRERADALGDLLDVPERFEDLDKMIAQTRPDIVAIPTATELHYELCMRVLEHGVNIDVEKPLCVDLEQADAVMAKVREKGVRISAHHQTRPASSMRAVDKAVSEGRIGDIWHIYANGNKDYYGGHELINIGTHTINNVIKFGGHCRSVTAIGLTDGRRITPDDVLPSPRGMGPIACEDIAATLEFDSGVTGTLLHHGSRSTDRARAIKAAGLCGLIELYGTEGRIWWSSQGAWWLPQPHFLPDGEHDKWQALELIYPEEYDPESGAEETEYWYVEEYVRALDEGRDHECGGADALHVIEIMMGIFESIAYNRRVELPQEQRDHPLLRWRLEAGMGAPDPMPYPYDEWLSAEDKRLGRA